MLVRIVGFHGSDQKSSFLATSSTLQTVTFYLMLFVASFCFAHRTQAQVVQLPSTRQVSVSTAVEIPDGGSISLGGIGRSAALSAQRQASHFGSKQTGRYGSGSGNVAIAKVIDLNELDRIILQEAQSPGRSAPYYRDSAALTGRHHPATNYRRLSDIPGAWMQALAGDPQFNPDRVPRADAASDIAVLIDRAQRAKKAGRFAAAEVYYRMALERLPSETIAKLEAALNQKDLSAAAGK